MCQWCRYYEYIQGQKRKRRFIQGDEWILSYTVDLSDDEKTETDKSENEGSGSDAETERSEDKNKNKINEQIVRLDL